MTNSFVLEGPIAPDKALFSIKIIPGNFSYSSAKTYVVGTH